MKKGLSYFILRLICFAFFGTLGLSEAVAAQKAVLSVKDTKGAPLGICSRGKNLLNCVVQITQYNMCLAQPGSVTITNTSSVVANNIQASSSDPNFNNYVVQNNNCPSSLAPGASCTISFYTNVAVNFSTSNVAVQGSNTNATYFDMNSFACQQTTLVASTNNLALSVSGLTEFGVAGSPASGTPRIITIANTGTFPANNVNVIPPSWPAGTTSVSNCGSNLPAGGRCSITITPGNTATSDGTNPCSSGTTPIPGVLQVTSNNANTVSANVLILSYGCIYQSGYVYAFDDTTLPTVSVGGKVATTSDQAPVFPSGIVWSSNGNSGTTPDGVADLIYGISEVSTTAAADPSTGQVSGQTACNGGTDGVCDTNNIYVYYQNDAAGAPINLSYYAVGLCKQTIASYSDWYLPAICEMGYGVTSPSYGLDSGCGLAGAPTTQNMQSSLVDFNSLNLLSGTYWSSTETSTFAAGSAWLQTFANPGSEYPFVNKTSQQGVRCSRLLT